jgi:hypothetical protein
MPAGPYIDKATLLGACICPARGWLTRNMKHASPPTEAEFLRMEEGIEIGKRARLLYPGGVLVPWQRADAGAEQTSRLMVDTSVSAIFEAAFIAGDYIAKADLLLREKRGWHLLEVKSSLNISQELVEDLAYTVMVAKRAGARISRASLLLLSGAYQIGMNDADLFVQHDCTKVVRKIVLEFDSRRESVATSVLAKEQPEPKLIFACKNCEFFSTHCLGKDARDSVFELPRLSERTFQRLVKRGVTTIPEIPARFPLTTPQRRVRRAIVTGKPVVAKTKLRKFLGNVNWPAFYLDFETVKSSIPLFPGIAPHEQIPTLYSIHVCNGPGNVTDHREFLAAPDRDRRRELAERLLADLDGAGQIVVYSSFENMILNKLSQLFDDLRPALQKCVSRLFDLEKAFRNWFCHPAFRGKTSIKVTLPVLLDISYDGLPIADGGTAVAKYARMARREITGAAAAQVRRDLLAYCKQDTMAMVKLHDRLVEICR